MSRGAFERGEGDHLNVRRGPLKESMVIIRRTEGVRLRRPMDTSWRVTLEKGEGHATGRSEGAALNWCIGIIGRDEGYHLKAQRGILEVCSFERGSGCFWKDRMGTIEEGRRKGRRDIVVRNRGHH